VDVQGLHASGSDTRPARRVHLQPGAKSLPDPSHDLPAGSRRPGQGVSGSGLEQSGTRALYDPAGRQSWNRPVPAQQEWWSERINGVARGVYFARLMAGPQTAAIRKTAGVR